MLPEAGGWSSPTWRVGTPATAKRSAGSAWVYPGRDDRGGLGESDDGGEVDDVGVVIDAQGFEESGHAPAKLEVVANRRDIVKVSGAEGGAQGVVAVGGGDVHDLQPAADADIAGDDGAGGEGGFAERGDVAGFLGADGGERGVLEGAADKEEDGAGGGDFDRHFHGQVAVDVGVAEAHRHAVNVGGDGGAGLGGNGAGVGVHIKVEGVQRFGVFAFGLIKRSAAFKADGGDQRAAVQAGDVGLVGGDEQLSGLRTGARLSVTWKEPVSTHCALSAHSAVKFTRSVRDAVRGDARAANRVPPTSETFSPPPGEPGLDRVYPSLGVMVRGGAPKCP